MRLKITEITKIIKMLNTTKLIVSFNNFIDNDLEKGGYNFKSKKEAIAIAQSLTSNKLTGFEWHDDNDKGDTEPYYYLSFTEQVITEIEDNGCQLYAQIDTNLNGQIAGGTYSSVRRAK